MNDDGDLYPIDKDGNLREPKSQSDLLAQYLKDIAYWRERCHKAEDKVVAHEAVARGLQKALEELKVTLPKQLTDAVKHSTLMAGYVGAIDERDRWKVRADTAEGQLARETARLDWLLPRQYNHNTRASIDVELSSPNGGGQARESDERCPAPTGSAILRL